MSFLSGVFFSRGFQVVDFLHGLPGSIDDSSAWKAVVAKVSLSTAVYAFGMIGGLLLATSEWWWPHVSRLTNRTKPNQETQELGPNILPGLSTNTAAAVLAQIEKFKELEPLIARHREAFKPIRFPFPITFITNTGQLNFKADHEELIAHLDALKIPSPLSDAGRVTWFRYLVHLEATCQTGDLQEARSLYEERRC